MFSILGKTNDIEENEELLRDLNLDSLFSEIDQEVGDCDITSLYTHLPADMNETKFRQDIFLEIDNELEDALWHFYQALRQAKSILDGLDDLTKENSLAHWYLIAAHTYYQAVAQLTKLLEDKQPRSEGWTQFLATCQELQCSEQYKAHATSVIKCYESITNLRFSFRIEGDHLGIYSQVSTDDILGDLWDKYPHMFTAPNRIPNLIEGSQESSLLEERIFQYLRKLHPEVFEELSELWKNRIDFLDDTLLTFQHEVLFYLAYLKFYRYMYNNEYSFCMPEFFLLKQHLFYQLFLW